MHAELRRQPPKPPIDQNPNNGSDPEVAPARAKPKADWDPTVGKWDLDKGCDAVLDAAGMLGLIDHSDFDPDQVCAGGLLGFQCTGNGNLLDPDTGVTYCNPGAGWTPGNTCVPLPGGFSPGQSGAAGDAQNLEAIAAGLKARVDTLHGYLPKSAQGRRSTAIIRAIDGRGHPHDVVGWSGDNKRGLDRLIKEKVQGREVMADRVAAYAARSGHRWQGLRTGLSAPGARTGYSTRSANRSDLHDWLARTTILLF